MNIVLLNFSDAPRSLIDRRNRTITVAVGEMRRADIHEAHFGMLKRGTFLALPGEVDIPARVTAAVELMGVVDTTQYDELLGKFWDLAGRDPNRLRPTRDYIRLALRDIAQNALAEIGVGKPAPQRVTITEEGDENTRRDPDDPPPPVREPDPPPPSQQPPPRQQRPQSNRPRQQFRTRTRA